MKRDAITCSGLMRDQHGGHIELKFETATAHLDLGTAKKLADEINVYIDLVKRGWPSEFSSSGVNLVYPREQEPETPDFYPIPIDKHLVALVQEFHKARQVYIQAINARRKLQRSLSLKGHAGKAFREVQAKEDEAEKRWLKLDEKLSVDGLCFDPDQSGVRIVDTAAAYLDPFDGIHCEDEGVHIDWTQLKRVAQILAAFDIHLITQEKENHEKF